MMIEQVIEKIVVDRLVEAVEDDDIQVIGTWQKATNGLKSNEDYSSKGVVVVKAYPRSYETPTIPSCAIDIEVTLNIRADVDFNGNDYLDITDKINQVFQEWQNDFTSYEQLFNIQEFIPTGYQLNGGNVGMDRNECIWTVQQSMIIYGQVCYNK